MGIIKLDPNLQVDQLTPIQRSIKLIECIALTESDESRFEAKMAIMDMTKNLFKSGMPDYYQATRFPRLSELSKEHGDKNIMKVIFLLVKDFCRNFNVVRNMTDDQMIEVASHFKILAEQDYMKLTLEYFIQFFNEAKIGKCGKIYDRIDFQVLNEMFENYYNRFQEGVENEMIQNARDLKFYDSPRYDQDNVNRKILSLSGAFGIVGNMIKGEIISIEEEIKKSEQ